MSDPDLRFVTDEDLLLELKRRHHSLVIGWSDDLDDRRYMLRSTFAGNTATCLGLARSIALRCEARLAGPGDTQGHDDAMEP